MFDIVLYQYSILLLRMSAVYSIMLQSLATYKLTGYINIIKINCQNCMLSNSFNVKCFLNQYVNFFKHAASKNQAYIPKSSFVRVLAPTNTPMSLNPRGAGHLCGLSLVYYWSLLSGFLWVLQL